AGYEAAISDNRAYISFAGQLHGLTSLPKPQDGKQYSPSLAAVHAVLTVGQSLIISEDKIAEFHKKILEEYKSVGMPKEVFEASVTFGNAVAKHVLAWAAKDNYKETRSLSKYTVDENEGTWKPTPPAYMRAVEPHWNEMRTFLIDSAQQFKPLPALTFSK